MENFCNGGTCENNIGGYKCHCPTGYIYNSITRSCEDSDECVGKPCIGGFCTNTPGGYTCKCPPGTQMNDKLKLCEGK